MQRIIFLLLGVLLEKAEGVWSKNSKPHPGDFYDTNSWGLERLEQTLLVIHQGQFHIIIGLVMSILSFSIIGFVGLVQRLRIATISIIEN